MFLDKPEALTANSKFSNVNTLCQLWIAN